MKTFLMTTAMIVVAGAASAATMTIETSSSDSYLQPIGDEVFPVVGDGDPNPPNIEFGQTFSVDTDGSLHSFGFQLDDSSGNINAPLEFKAKVAIVDGDSYDFVFESAVQTSSGDNPFEVDGVAQRSVYTLGEGESLSLTAGTLYAIVFEAVGGGPVGFAVFDNSSELSGGDEYADGNFIYSGAETNDFMSVGFLDADFEVTYKDPEVVPIAGALPLLASGLAVFGVAGLRRRRK